MIAAVLFSTFSASIAFAVPEAASGITFFQTENTHFGRAGSAERNQARIDGILYLLSQPGEVPAAIVNQMKADMAEAGRLFEAGDLDGAARIMGRMQAGILTATTGAAGAVQLSAAGARALAKITKTPIAYRQINAMGAEVTSADLPTGFTRVAHPNGDIVIMAPDGQVYASVDEIPVPNRGQLFDNPSAAVGSRVDELTAQIPENSRGRITMGVAVVEDVDGNRSLLVSTSEPNGYLRPGVNLNEGEVLVPGSRGSHAEADIVRYAQENGLTIIDIGATRPVCAGCQGVIPDGTNITTPLR